MTDSSDIDVPDSSEAFDPSPYLPQHDDPNTRPGPTDQGGHGGMATREQESRLQDESGHDQPANFSNTDNTDTKDLR